MADTTTQQDTNQSVKIKQKTLIVKQSKSADFDIVNEFNGYRSKEDMTILPPGYLVPGSQNVLTTTEGGVASRQGYTLDGQNDTTIAPINSSFDWKTHLGFNRNIRVGNGKLQCRYVASGGEYLNGYSYYTLSFDGAGDNVTTATATTPLNGDFSFSIRVKFTSSADMAILREKTSVVGGTGAYYLKTSSSGKVNCIIEGNSAGTAFSTGLSTSALNDGTWHNIIVTFVASTKTISLYVDGVLNGSTTYSAAFTRDASSGGMELGKAFPSYADFSGQMGDVRVYDNIVLSSSEITTLATSNLVATPTTPTLWWKLNEVTGTTATDSIGTNNGTETGVTRVLEDSMTSGQVYWIDVITGLTTAQEAFNFTPYWDTSELKQLLLFVNGQSQIQMWSGGIATLLSSTVNTLTLSGTDTWAQKGFLLSGARSVVINGNTYTYTGGEGTTTLTGVTPDPTGEALNSLVIQSVRTTLNSAMTGIAATFENDLISILRNQVYIGSFKNNTVYVSKVNDYTNYSFTTPTRVVGEGALLTFDDVPKGFAPQEDTMYVSAGLDWWYKVTFSVSADLTAESITVLPLKTSALEGAQSQALIGKVINSVFFVSNEPVLTDLGRVANNLATPQAVNISDPIKPEFSAYDFTNASVTYHKYNVYVALPAESKVLIYNLAKGWWEAPQIMPITRFSVIDGDLYGHSSQSPVTFKMFTGYNDNGNPINCIAAFSYQSYGMRGHKKNMNEMYFEGYLSSNTSLAIGIKYDFGGFNGIQQFTASGNALKYIFATTVDASFGKNPLGEQPIGSITDSPLNMPKYRSIFTTRKINFFETQVFFQTNDVDQQWQILCYGGNIMLSADQNADIKQ